jgi:orsellinic acid C2-O-methyltransferase
MDRAALLSMINGAWMCQAIGLACELDLPDRLGSGPQPVDALARATRTHAPSLRRLLRALVTLGITEETGNDAFALGPAGRRLLRDAPDSLRGWALLASTRVWRSWGDMREGIRTGESVRRRTKGFADFGDLDSDPTEADVFNRAMISVTRPIAAALCAVIDFGGAACIVDVGGGPGHLLAALLKANPSARGVVFDLAHASEMAKRTLRDAGVADRARFLAGTFFDSAPSADAYILKSVLHNWDDERASRILRSVRAAMRPKGHAYIVERIMPERLSTSDADREVVRADLQMLLGCDGCERTLSQYGALLQAAGLKSGMTKSLGNDFSVIEAVAA